MSLLAVSDNAPPVIGVVCCYRAIGAHPFHIAGAKYVEAAAAGAGGLPWLIPALGDGLPVEALLDRLDGLLFTGSPSNVHPTRYHPTPEAITCGPYDEARDATTLPLIRGALARGLPLLAICRGFQELNVALGGTLHPRVHEVAGLADHRQPPGDDPEVLYAPAHPVSPVVGGMLAAWAPADGPLTVNSLHGQGIDRAAAGLIVEATAPDGLVEAARVAGQSFAVGVQWHPEWRFADNPFSVKLFAAFGAAARTYARRRVSRAGV
jgi:putative glutamine amidotransferase